MKTFDQSEHDTRIWYHGSAASKACLQAPPPFPLPQTTAGLAFLADIISLFPPLRSLLPGYFQHIIPVYRRPVISQF